MERTHFAEDKQISTKCKDLIRSLLRCDTESRLSANEALQHEWIVKGGRVPLEEELSSDVESSMIMMDVMEYSVPIEREQSESSISQQDELSSYKLSSKRSTLVSSAITRSMIVPHSALPSRNSMLVPPLGDVREDGNSEQFDFGVLDGLDINDFLDSVDLNGRLKRPISALSSAQPTLYYQRSDGQSYEMMAVEQDRPNTTKASATKSKGQHSQFRFSGIIQMPDNTTNKMRWMKSADYLYED